MNPDTIPLWFALPLALILTWKALMPKKLTTGQVAALFGVTVPTVRRWADENKLPYTRTLGGDRRFDPLRMQQILDGQQ